jgi:hypothetical protein
VSISANGKRLAMLTLQIANQWQQTKETWKDVKSLEFEHQYLEVLVTSVEKSLAIIEQLDKLVGKARKDCE